MKKATYTFLLIILVSCTPNQAAVSLKSALLWATMPWRAMELRKNRKTFDEVIRQFSENGSPTDLLIRLQNNLTNSFIKSIKKDRNLCEKFLCILPTFRLRTDEFADEANDALRCLFHGLITREKYKEIGERVVITISENLETVDIQVLGEASHFLINWYIVGLLKDKKASTDALRALFFEAFILIISQEMGHPDTFYAYIGEEGLALLSEIVKKDQKVREKFLKILPRIQLRKDENGSAALKLLFEPFLLELLEDEQMMEEIIQVVGRSNRVAHFMVVMPIVNGFFDETEKETEATASLQRQFLVYMMSMLSLNGYDTNDFLDYYLLGGKRAKKKMFTLVALMLETDLLLLERLYRKKRLYRKSSKNKNKKHLQ